MQATLRLPFHFKPELLKADLAQIQPDDWVDHFNQSIYEGEWSGVALRSVGGRPMQLYPDPTATDDFADTELLLRCPYYQRVLSTFQCPLTSVRLLRLKAGSSIREHRDYRLGYEDGEVRLHIPVITNGDVAFFLQGERVWMAEGECWYLDVNLPHRVDNRSATDRIHLVIDCVVNEWLANFFRAEAPPLAAVEMDTLPAHDFPAFYQFVLQTPTLQDELYAIAEKDAFVQRVVTLGQEHGYTFTEGVVAAAMQAQRRAWIERWIR